MLKQFKVNPEDSLLVQSKDLGNLVSAIFQKMGVPKEDADLGSDVLVSADLRGVDSHGVSNMLRNYVNGYTSGQINPTPDMKIIKESPATANIDSDRGLGIITVPKAMDIAIEKANTVGVGMVTIGNARHLGMASYHAMKALEHPFVFDAATSAVASNKIGIARRLGAKLEPGWLADEFGTPIMETMDVPEKYQLLPVGATRELGSHKGYGLSCIVDILGGVLTGFGYGANPGRPNFGHYVAAYKIDAFTDVDEFKSTMDEWMHMMKSTKPAPGEERVMVAGQPEHEMEMIRSKEGIPLHEEVVDWFKDICGELSIDFSLG